MSNDPKSPNRFPFGLTLAVAIALTILIGLGVWQVKRLAWKENLLAHIAALKTAPPVPIGPVLARLRAGEDVEWTRVEASCTPARHPMNDGLKYSLRDGKIIWRVVVLCHLADGPYRSILLDRGYLESSAGQMSSPSSRSLPPGNVVGVLRRAPTENAGGVLMMEVGGPDARQALDRFEIVAEHEDPAPPGITPSGLPEKISNNHLSYALTWFGLAGALLAVYAAMLFRRLKSAA